MSKSVDSDACPRPTKGDQEGDRLLDVPPPREEAQAPDPQRDDRDAGRRAAEDHEAVHRRRRRVAREEAVRLL